MNNKVYIGKSRNIYKRIHQHLYDLKNSRSSNSNTHLSRAFNKYGVDIFEYSVLEYLPEDEALVSRRELHWMKAFNSLNRDFGYNIRSDSDSRMVVHNQTRLKISKRLKKEWSGGVRDGHSEKMKEYWEGNKDRREQASKIMTKNKTKYVYIVSKVGEGAKRECTYRELVGLGLKSAISSFYKLKKGKVKCKGFNIERIKIKYGTPKTK